MVGAVALVTLVATVPLLKTNLLCIDVHAAATFPEAEAMAFVRDRQLRGRMVTFFDWGQYAIWHKPDALRVSMDGRRETVYPTGAWTCTSTCTWRSRTGCRIWIR